MGGRLAGELQCKVFFPPSCFFAEFFLGGGLFQVVLGAFLTAPFISTSLLDGRLAPIERLPLLWALERKSPKGMVRCLGL